MKNNFDLIQEIIKKVYDDLADSIEKNGGENSPKLFEIFAHITCK
jgi:hypothetical protein